MDDPEETEDALSFCDLPIYSNPEDWESFSKEYPSDQEDDSFEFFSEEFSGSISSTASSRTSIQPDNIMFCGKLIPYKHQEPISNNKCKSNTKKVSASNSRRWYLFMFGLGSFPVEMELSDMRRRQSRRVPAAVVRSEGSGCDEVGVCRRRGKGLWRMIRLYLGCGSGRQADAVVKASYWCMPRV
ncbi:hypothetical protein LguiA_023586 [Lonicera macranthoides]